MTFGQKIKKLRTDNHYTQDMLAQRLLVTRTAVSKWETDKGYPSIDSLKMISNLFGVNIDDLISDDDIKNKKLIDERRANKYYCIAMAFLALSVAGTLTVYFTGIGFLSVTSLVGVIGYVICAVLSKPKYKRIEAKKFLFAYLLSRVFVLAIVVGIIVYTIATIA